MSKKIWAGLIICLVLIAGFWSWPDSKPEITQPNKETAQPQQEEVSKPSTDDNALAAASTDLSLLQQRRTAKKVIKIGAIFPLSGSSRDEGNAFKNALLLAQNDLKFQDPKYNYKFVVDDGFDNDKIATVYQKQTKLDKVNAIISFGKPYGNIIAPLAEQDGIIHVNFGASDPSIADGKYNFINWTMPEVVSQRMLKFYQQQNLKNIVFIGEDNAEKHALEEMLQKLAEKDGIIITSFWLDSQEKDFSPLLAKTSTINPDTYLLQIHSNQIEPFAKQYKEAGNTALLTNIETFSSLADFNSVEGAYYTDVAQSLDVFNNRVKKAYPDTNSIYALGTVYDSIMILVQSFERGKMPQQAVDELAKTKEYDGVVGLLTQDENGIFNSEAVLKQIINGQPVIIDDGQHHNH